MRLSHLMSTAALLVIVTPASSAFLSVTAGCVNNGQPLTDDPPQRNRRTHLKETW